MRPLPPVQRDSAIVVARATTSGEQARWTAMRITARVFEQTERLMLVYPGSSQDPVDTEADNAAT